MFSSEDEKYMLRALELAAGGAGAVSPNPLVGAVIVKDGEIIAEGFHKRFGDLHAEADALRNAERAGKDVSGASIYVNLEPCSHRGKQPPCVDAIIKSKIAKVVFGMTDPNPLVSGRGEKILSGAGIEVCKGVLEAECRRINRFFIKHIVSGVPFVILKAALSIDGSIACRNGSSGWISSPESRKRVHALRSQVDAVLIGKGTALKDNPRLTVRSVAGRNPKRIIADSRLSLPEDLNVFNDETRSNTYLLYAKDLPVTDKVRRLEARGIHLVGIEPDESGQISSMEMLKFLGAGLNVNSVLVEGGAGIFTSFLSQRLADEFYFYVCPELLGEGIRFDNLASPEKVSDAMKIKFTAVNKVGADIEIIGEKTDEK